MAEDAVDAAGGVAGLDLMPSVTLAGQASNSCTIKPSMLAMFRYWEQACRLYILDLLSTPH